MLQFILKLLSNVFRLRRVLISNHLQIKPSFLLRPSYSVRTFLLFIQNKRKPIFFDVVFVFLLWARRSRGLQSKCGKARPWIPKTLHKNWKLSVNTTGLLNVCKKKPFIRTFSTSFSRWVVYLFVFFLALFWPFL